ncbi:hypothetical protein [Sphingomonas hankookensis]|uniref:hypothetical protein n=1 Tax=Sphingomonas hankookensis TaxID=563996 RepID=UPI003D303CEE
MRNELPVALMSAGFSASMPGCITYEMTGRSLVKSTVCDATPKIADPTDVLEPKRLVGFDSAVE